MEAKSTSSEAAKVWVNVYSTDETRFLKSFWKFWVGSSARGLSAAEFESRLDTLATVKNPSDFWSVWGVITKPTEMEESLVYHFMVDGIKPMWTDAALKDGGTYAFSIRRRDADNVFKHLLIAAIAGNMQPILNGTDEIVGVSISVKKAEGFITLWNKSAKAASLVEMMKFVKMILPDLKYSQESYRHHSS